MILEAKIPKFYAEFRVDVSHLPDPVLLFPENNPNLRLYYPQEIAEIGYIWNKNDGFPSEEKDDGILRALYLVYVAGAREGKLYVNPKLSTNLSFLVPRDRDLPPHIYVPNFLRGEVPLEGEIPLNCLSYYRTVCSYPTERNVPAPRARKIPAP